MLVKIDGLDIVFIPLMHINSTRINKFLHALLVYFTNGLIVNLFTNFQLELITQYIAP